MHYIGLIVIGAACYRLTADGRWDAWWIGFLALLFAGVLIEANDRRRIKARREAAYQKRKAQRNA